MAPTVHHRRMSNGTSARVDSCQAGTCVCGMSGGPCAVGQTCTSEIWMSAARYPPQLFTSTPSALMPAMIRSGTTRAGGQS